MRWSDWVLHYSDRFRWYILGTIILVYLIGFTGVWRPEPDAALYLTLGRNLAEGHGYVYHDQPHRLAYPGWPWVLSGLFRLSPDHAVFLAHVMTLLYGLAGLALMYRLMSLHTTRPTAVLVTFGLAASRTYYRYCYELRSDMQFMLGVMMVLAGYEGIVRRGSPAQTPTNQQPRPWLDWSLLTLGLVVGVVSRPTLWPILAAVMCAIAWDTFRGRLSRKFVIVLAIPVVAGGLFVAFRGASDYEDYLIQSLSWEKIALNLKTVFEPMASEALFGLDFGKELQIGFLSLNMVGSMVAVAIGLSMFRRRALWGLIVLFTLGMMTFTLALDRYFLPLMPILVYGWWLAIRWVNGRLPRRWGNTLFVLLFIVGAFPNGAKVGDLFIEQRHRNPLTAFRHGRYESIYRVGDMVAKHVPPGAWVIGPKKMERILTYISRRWVLVRRQAEYVDPAKVPVYVLQQPEVETEPLPFSDRLGPEIERVQGKYDKQPWTLHRVK